MIQMNLLTKQRLTDLIALTYGCLYTLLYLKWTTNKDLLHKTSMLCSSLNGRGGEWIHTCMCTAESPCCSPEAVTTLLIGYTSIQNKGLFFFLFYLFIYLFILNFTCLIWCQTPTKHIHHLKNTASQPYFSGRNWAHSGVLKVITGRKMRRGAFLKCCNTHTNHITRLPTECWDPPPAESQ